MHSSTLQSLLLLLVTNTIPRTASLCINTSSRTLFSYLETRINTNIAALSSTHYPNNPTHRPDTLGIAILKTGTLGFQLKNFISDLSFDHSSIILDIFSHAAQSSPSKQSFYTNWSKYHDEISSLSLPALRLSSSSIDSAITNLSKIIHTTVKKFRFIFDFQTKLSPKKNFRCYPS